MIEVKRLSRGDYSDNRDHIENKLRGMYNKGG